MLKLFGKNDAQAGDDKVIYFVTRFSILLSNKNWAISRNNAFEEYKDILFSANRLDKKFIFFENLVLPYLDNAVEQANGLDVKLILLISTELPEKYKQRLDKLCQNRRYLILCPIPVQSSFIKNLNKLIKNDLLGYKKNIAFTTVRLDDDDLLSNNFTSLIKKYLTPDFCNSVVTFSRGIEAMYDFNSRKIDPCIRINFPKIALGLSHINYFHYVSRKFSAPIINVYETGDHTKVHVNFHMIIDAAKDVYLRLSYEEQDTAAKGINARLAKNKPDFISSDAVCDIFQEVRNIL